MSLSDNTVNKDPTKTKSSLSELLKQQHDSNSGSNFIEESNNNNASTRIIEKNIPSEGSNSISEDESFSNVNNKFNGMQIGSTKNQNINLDGASPFSQSFIRTNNAHTVAFGSSVQQNDSLVSSVNNNDIQGRRNHNISFSQKNYPSLSSSIPYSVPDHISSGFNAAAPPKDVNGIDKNIVAQLMNMPEYDTDNDSSHHGSLGSDSTSSSFVDLMPANVSQIDSNVIRSPQVANVEARFVLSKQKLHEKQMSNLSWSNENGFGGSSSAKKSSFNTYFNNFSSAGNGSYKDNSKTINHSSSFNRKPSFNNHSSSPASSSITTMISKTGSIGNILFNSKKDQNMSSSPKTSSSPAASKLTSSLKNSKNSSNGNLSVNGDKHGDISSPAKTRQESIYNNQRNGLAVKTSGGGSFSSAGSTPSSGKMPHSFARYFKKNNDNTNAQPSVSTFNTHAIVKQPKSNGTQSSPVTTGDNFHDQPKSNKSSISESRDSRSSVSSSTFQGPSSLGNTDILYQSSNNIHYTDQSKPRRSSQASQGLTEQALQHTAHLPFSKRYNKTGDQLGAGAGGSVSIAVRIIDKKQFAVKEFRAKYESEKKRDYIKKINAEFCIGISLKHPNIVETIELVYENNRMLQVMEYCDFDLFAIVTSNKMSFEETCCCFKQILNGIEYLHSIGLAHRDLKLDNCVLNKNGIVKLIDFGAAVVFSYPLSNKLVTASGIVGSDPYLPPEVCIFSKYDPRPVDIWSIAMIFVCLTIKQFPWKIPKLKDPSFKLFCSGRDCDSLSQLVAKPALPPQYYEVVDTPESSNNPSNPDDLKIGPQSLLHKLPEASRNVIGRMIELAPARRASIEEIMEDPFVKSIKMCYLNHEGTVVNYPENHVHTVVDQSVAHIAGLEKNKNK